MPTCEICHSDLGLKGKVQPGGGFLCEFCDNKVNTLRPASFIPPTQDEKQPEPWTTRVPWALFAGTVLALIFCIFLLFKGSRLEATARQAAEDEKPKDLKGMAKELFDTKERNTTLAKKNNELEDSLKKVRGEINSRLMPQARQYMPEANLKGIKGFSIAVSLAGDFEGKALEHKFTLTAELAFSKADLQVAIVALPLIHFQIQSKRINGAGEPSRFAVLFSYDVFEQVIPTERDLGKAAYAEALLPPPIQGSTWRYFELLVTSDDQFDADVSEAIRQQVAKLAAVIKTSKY